MLRPTGSGIVNPPDDSGTGAVQAARPQQAIAMPRAMRDTVMAGGPATATAKAAGLNAEGQHQEEGARHGAAVQDDEQARHHEHGGEGREEERDHGAPVQ